MSSFTARESPNNRLRRTVKDKVPRHMAQRAAAEPERYATPAIMLLRARMTVVAMIFAAFGSAAAQPIGSTPAVGPIDHIMIRAEHPETLFTLFTQTFELPVAWPLANRGGVTSGGVSFGNVNLEAIKFPGQLTAESSLVGFAFEPGSALSDSLAELDRRGVAYGNLRPFVITTSDGAAATLWTNVTLSQFSDSDTPADATLHIFLSEYTPAYVDSEQRRERLRTVLAQNDGGPLGIEGVVEVTVGTTNPDVSRELWGELLAPQASSAEGSWTVGHGPSIRLVRAAEAAIQGLVVRVRSLGRAEAFLREQGLLGSVSQDLVMIDPNGVEGLRISLVENEM